MVVHGTAAVGTDTPLTSVIVDRRSQKGKSAANRQRLLKRLDGALKAQLGKLVARHKLQDGAQPAEVTIERKDAGEPRIILDPASGASGRIIPGNDKYHIGDKIPNSGSEGRGQGQGAGDGEEDDEDTFRFALSRTEYLSLLFDDLELPTLVKKDLLEIDENRFRRGGMISYRSVLLITMLMSLPLALTPYISSLPLVMFELFFAMFVAAGFVILSIAYATDVFPPEDSGLIAGLGAGSWSAAVALAMPVFGRLFDQHRYEPAFLIAALFPVVGFALWTGLTRTSAE